MARTRVTKPLMIGSWKEADEVLEKLAELERVIVSSDLQLNRAIDELKSRNVAYLQGTIEMKATLEKELCLFCDLHREDFGSAKSRQLNHGTVGYRRSTSISLTRSVSEVVSALRSKGLERFVLHKEDTVDKKQMHVLSDEQLMEVGAQRKSKDVFFVDTNLDSVKEATKEA